MEQEQPTELSLSPPKGKKGSLKLNFSADTFVTSRPDFDKLNLLNASEKVDLELMLAKRADLTYRADKGEVMRILTQNNQLDAFRNGGFDALNSFTRQQINGLKITIQTGANCYTEMPSTNNTD